MELDVRVLTNDMLYGVVMAFEVNGMNTESLGYFKKHYPKARAHRTISSSGLQFGRKGISKFTNSVAE